MTAKTLRAHAFEASVIEARVAPLLLQPLPASAYVQLARYLDLLFRWNEKMNLTAVRNPSILVELHIAECLRAAQRIPEGVETVLDFGSGAGLPGIPIQIARPGLRVTLAESQKKKAAFLREAVRELGLVHASVHLGRVEDLATAETFDLVTLRAVDKMADALQVAFPHIHPPQGARRGWCMVLTALSEVDNVGSAADRLASASQPVVAPAIAWLPHEAIPGTHQRVLLLGTRIR
ncbi:MAG: 16S rRNA (guanine(527)-N(7))-methyltransferase RsmG [Acidobacteriaceae bacterium]